MIFLKVGYFGDTLGEDNIIEVPFIILNKYVPIELSRYVDNYSAEVSRRKVIYNDWYKKVLKGHTSAVKLPYRMKKIYQGYYIVATRREMKNASEAKSNIPRSPNTKLSCNQLNKKVKFCYKFGTKVPKSTRAALIMDMIINDTLWVDDITKYISAL